MSTPLRWSSFETWNKLMTWKYLWKYPTFPILGTRTLGFMPRSNRRQTIFTIIGESLLFIIMLFVPCLLLIVEILYGQNLGLLPNLILIFLIVISSLSMQFSFVLFNHRELVASMTTCIVDLESQLSNGK
jgi:hypothetical protein